jgi:YHS domain-containing protein
MLKQPVCKMMVDENKARYVSEAEGKKEYLCSAACKLQFDVNPKRHASDVSI